MIAFSCCQLLLLLAFVGFSQAYEDQDRKPALSFDIIGYSFALNSRITLEDHIAPSVVYEVEEMHSVWQKRSKLRYRKGGFYNPKSATKSVYHTVYVIEKKLLLVNPSQHVCSLVNNDYVDELLNLNILKDFSFHHFIGASKLLVFVENHIALFTMTDAKASQLPNGIPSMIVITTSKAITYYEFTQFRLLTEEMFHPANLGSNPRYYYREPDTIELDMFALPLGCSRVLMDTHEDSPTLTVMDNFRFSFYTLPATKQGIGSSELTVAYEPHLAVLTTKQRQATRAVTAITDFKHNLKFHIIRKLSNGDDFVFNKVLNVDKDHSCIVSKVGVDKIQKHPPWNPFSLGKMLLGTNRLVYTGLARVRGILARMYESYDCDLPIWLEHPIIYEDYMRGQLQTDDKNEGEMSRWPTFRMRSESESVKERNFYMISVFYFTYTGSNENDILSGKLVLIEVMTMKPSGRVYKQQSFPVHDFSWDLPNASPDSGRYEDLFSLDDNCLAGVEDNAHAHIEMLLETSSYAKNHEWLQNRMKRNIAILKMLQHDLSMMSPAFYDLESRFVVENRVISTPDEVGPRRLANLAASMLESRRNKATVRLVLAGKGFLRALSFVIVQTLNFEMCYMLAAHQRKNTIFAYQSPESECHILKADQKVDDIASVTKETFSPSKWSSMRVFQILSQDEYESHFDRLKIMRENLRKRHDLYLFDPTLIDIDFLNSNASAQLRIKNFYIRTPTDETNFDFGENHRTGANKFLSFGLVAADDQNKLVEPKWTIDSGTSNYHEKEMTLEHCRTACMADLECSSFSICLTGDKMRCVLSDVSFAVTPMIHQLMIFINEKVKLGHTFPIQVYRNGQTISTETMHVVKHPGCELHSKLYRDFFVKMPRSESSGRLDALIPVANLERCAEMCYKKTLQIMRQDGASNNSISAESAARQGQIDFRGICSTMYYVDHETVLLRDEKVAEQIVDYFKNSSGEHSEAPGGYCIIDNEGLASTDMTQTRLIGVVRLDVFSFDFVTFYAKQPGLTLASSPMTPEAKALVRDGVLDDTSTYGQLENFGFTRAGSLDFCALTCSSLKSKMTATGCRSFDYIEIIKPGAQIHSICAFNSVNLKLIHEANRYDLVKRGADEQERVSLSPDETARVSHYEPRLGIAARNLGEIYNVVRARDHKETHSKIHLDGFVLFCAIVLALSLGLATGLILGTKIIIKMRMNADDTEILINDVLRETLELPKVEFSNIVNSDGKILDQSQKTNGLATTPNNVDTNDASP